MKSHGEGSLKKVFRDNRLKATPQRLDVLKLLLTSDEHLDAEEIYQRLMRRKKNVSRATIYRTLEVLVENEFVRKLDFGDGRMRYEHNQNPEKHHDHMVCQVCGKVIEFFNPQIEDLQELVAEQHQFVMLAHTMHIYGLCSDCADLAEAEGNIESTQN
jgi:Fur family ferric uptake transcriptional regulator